jgi:hypothetical protein
MKFLRTSIDRRRTTFLVRIVWRTKIFPLSVKATRPLIMFFILTDNNQWSIIEIFGFKPPPRLDFAYCKATFSKPYSNIESKEVVNELSEINDLEPKHFNSSTKETLYNFLVIHGGMDTSGNIFDDIFLINLI